MKRNYSQGKTESDVKFFVGQEVEHTPAYGMRTLFVTGVQPVSEIQDWLDDFNSFEDKSKHIEHIYFGANMSFPNIPVNNGAEWAKWETMIYHFLDNGYLCTLDIDISCVEGLVESGFTEYNNFIPMISAKLPYIQLLGYNAILKIDDKDFNASNPGVWCHSVNELKNRNNFTDWSKYTKDTILK
jgi:hypothetical protein